MQYGKINIIISQQKNVFRRDVSCLFMIQIKGWFILELYFEDDDEK